MTPRCVEFAAFVVFFSIAAPGLGEEKKLGWLSKRYEADRKDGPASISPGKEVDGKKDSGGKSYGSFQLASQRGVGGASVRAFVESYYENDFGPFDAGAGKRVWLKPGTEAFDDKWREVVRRDGDRFLNNEYEFIYETHYEPVVNDVQAATGLDIAARGSALQNVVFSVAVQHGSELDVAHGHGHELIRKAVAKWSREQLSVAPGTPERESVSDRDLIDAIYDERARTKPNEAETRYRRERADALDAQANEPSPQSAPDLNKTALGQVSRGLGILAGPIRPPPQELFVERGQATFDFSGFETPYETSRNPTVPGDYSGVRIGRGYDLGRLTKEQAERDLKAAGLSDAQVQTYAGAAGLKGGDAKACPARFAYGPLSGEARAAGLSGAELSRYIADRTPQPITLAQQKALFETAYRRAEDEARRAFPDYDTFPAPAREAVADMIFDRGLEELKRTKPGRLDHVARHDWDVAAATSKRNGAGVARNRNTRRLLESAASGARRAGPALE